MDLGINQAENLIDKLMDFFSVSTYSQLAIKINTTQQTISSWKQRNSTNAIKKKSKELGIYNEIFGDFDFTPSNNINENESVSADDDLSKYFIALESVASATGKNDELIEDIKNLMKKYIG